MMDASSLYGSQTAFEALLQRLLSTHLLTTDEWETLIAMLHDDHLSPQLREERYQRLERLARQVAFRHFQGGVRLRGLIEISSFCRNNCYYCGLRAANQRAQRYRLSHREVMACCERGYAMGFRTFVLQGGEDVKQDDDWMVTMVTLIRKAFPDVAITLSVGERSDDAYLRFRQAGADRYLLRHETHNAAHYAQLHPAAMSGENRLRCLHTLKRLGYQVGAGMMIGSPGQTRRHLAEDFSFMQQLQPEMIGAGPFLPADGTPFEHESSGSAALTLTVVALLRLAFPSSNIPATTALGTLCKDGRERALRAGANVLMPNLSPTAVREKYGIYNHKLATGLEGIEGAERLAEWLQTQGWHVEPGRGDFHLLNDDIL